MKRSRWMTAAGSVAALSLVLTACGSSGGGAQEDTAQEGSVTEEAAAADSGGDEAAAEASGEPILVGLPIAQSGPAGIADHADCLNGATLAKDEINAAGGVGGRPIDFSVTDIDILTPEGITAGFQKLSGEGVAAFVSPFVIIPPPALEAAAAYGAPYMSGDTNIDAQVIRASDPAKYGNYFVDPPETYYGSGFVKFLSNLADSGQWTPKNTTVDIIRGDTAYNQNIATATIEAIEASGGQWQLGEVIDITAGTKDWGPVLQKLAANDAGVIMVDHWIGAELASFSQQFAADPVEGSLVYLQYGPSQPEYLDIAGDSAEGFVWGTVIGTGNTSAEDVAFREAYHAATGTNDVTMGMVYPAWCYDMINVLAQAWNSTDPADFTAVNEFIASNPYNGVTGYIDFANGVVPSFPNDVSDASQGTTHYFYQVQGGRHTVIDPFNDAEAQFVAPPWM
ncbi:MAG: ABC transporter substrate-binding protein [Ilumatobacteraceae bacterium]|jgi:branched-chain amino acid transport system substrate-binding protein